MTYNVHDLLDDADAVTHVIRSCRPDIACLQEVPRRLFAGRRVRRLALESGMRWAARGVGSGGTAVFTAPWVDVLGSSVLRLPVAHWWTRTRGCAVVRLPGLTVVSVHLPLRPADRLAHVSLMIDRLVGPCVVAGDLNEPPGGPAWAALAAVVTDPGGGGSTYPARAPRCRIDAVLGSAGVSVTDLVVAGEREHLAARDLVAASDHLPLLADVTV